MRDIELALFGLLPSAALLGGPVAPVADESEGLAGAQGGAARQVVVSLPLPRAMAAATLMAGGIVLRDDELTPIAWLAVREPGSPAQVVSPIPDAAAGAGDANAVADAETPVVVTGVLHPVRRRESGGSRGHALTENDLAGPRGRTVVVFARPPVAGEAEAVESSLRAGGRSGGLLALISDDPAATVPAAVMLDVVESWLAEVGLSEGATLRTAPLAWRDPASNAALVARLGRGLGAREVLWLDQGDGEEGEDGAAEGGAANGAARPWAAALAALQRGDDLPSGVLTDGVAARLRRWRRPRAERGLVMMFSGLSGSGKSTLARDVADWIGSASERTVSLLDGDVVRTMLSSGLGFSRGDRELNIRRIGYVASEVARHGGIAICAPIAPYAATRGAVRAMAEAVGDFVLVHVSTPLEVCEARDLKGLYAKARAGLIPEFTGVSDPYEVPHDADLRVDTSTMSREAARAVVVDHLTAGGWLTA